MPGDTGCWWCGGWGCRRCRPNEGEQGRTEQERELDKLKAQVRRLETPVCCPNCGTEVERKAS